MVATSLPPLLKPTTTAQPTSFLHVQLGSASVCPLQTTPRMAQVWARRACVRPCLRLRLLGWIPVLEVVVFLLLLLLWVWEAGVGGGMAWAWAGWMSWWMSEWWWMRRSYQPSPAPVVGSSTLCCILYLPASPKAPHVSLLKLR